MTPLERAQQGLQHHTLFNGTTLDEVAIYALTDSNVCHEFPHDQGQFTVGDFRALVEEFTELQARVDGLEK